MNGTILGTLTRSPVGTNAAPGVAAWDDAVFGKAVGNESGCDGGFATDGAGWNGNVAVGFVVGITVGDGSGFAGGASGWIDFGRLFGTAGWLFASGATSGGGGSLVRGGRTGS